MQQSADSHDQSATRRVTVAEAAALLGVSTDSIRSRLRRGTLQREDAADGTILVILPSDTDSQPTVATNHPTVSASQPTVEYVELLQEHITRLEQELADRKEEAKRKDHLLAAALERIPAIEAPREPRESPVVASEGEGGGEMPSDTERRSWWQRWFGAG